MGASDIRLDPNGKSEYQETISVAGATSSKVYFGPGASRAMYSVELTGAGGKLYFQATPQGPIHETALVAGKTQSSLTPVPGVIWLDCDVGGTANFALRVSR